MVALAKRDKIHETNLRANDVATFTKESLLDFLLERGEVNISEFELLKFVVTWCRYSGDNVNSFTDYIDFGKFNIEQVCLFVYIGWLSYSSEASLRNGPRNSKKNSVQCTK